MVRFTDSNDRNRKAWEITEQEKNDNHVGIAIYQTEALSAYAKGHPERTLVKYLQWTFDQLNLSYHIAYDLDPVPMDNDPTVDKSATLTEWKDRKQGDNGYSQLPVIRKDSVPLLTRRGGGGISYRSGEEAICPAGDISEAFHKDPIQPWATPTEQISGLYGTIHEICHNLGHSDSNGDNWGETWIDDEEEAWYRTPTGIGGQTNWHGHENPTQPSGYEKRNCFYMPDYAKQYMDIV